MRIFVRFSLFHLRFCFWFCFCFILSHCSNISEFGFVVLLCCLWCVGSVCLFDLSERKRKRKGKGKEQECARRTRNTGSPTFFSYLLSYCCSICSASFFWFCSSVMFSVLLRIVSLSLTMCRSLAISVGVSLLSLSVFLTVWIYLKVPFWQFVFLLFFLASIVFVSANYFGSFPIESFFDFLCFVCFVAFGLAAAPAAPPVGGRFVFCFSVKFLLVLSRIVFQTSELIFSDHSAISMKRREFSLGAAIYYLFVTVM